MRRPRPSRRLVVVLTLTLAAPIAPVLASPVPPVVEAAVREVPLGVGETVQQVADGVQLVGVTWDAGSPQVSVRWRTPAGWTEWEGAEPSDAVDESDLADTRPGTEPVWRPRDADLVAVRVDGAVDGAEMVAVGDGEVRGGGVTFGLPTADAAIEHHNLGTVQTRADWGADERMRRGAPSYASTVRAVVVHHTAGGNDYRPEDVPARLRADYAYHVRARGWADLGYNLVVDKWGRLWEGRAGGLDRAVIGTHAAGFNTGTFGVSVMGDYTKATAGRDVTNALARVAAHAARTWRFNPAGWTSMRSGGSPRYANGAVVQLPTVHGHRDTGRTACPGQLYDLLQLVRDRAQMLLAGPPAVTALTVDGVPVHAPEPMTIDAQLSRDAWWALFVHDSSGREVARTGGRSTAPSLSWDGQQPSGVDGQPSPAPAGRYRWTLEVDDAIHPVQRRTEEFEVANPPSPPPLLPAVPLP